MKPGTIISGVIALVILAAMLPDMKKMRSSHGKLAVVEMTKASGNFSGFLQKVKAFDDQNWSYPLDSRNIIRRSYWLVRSHEDAWNRTRGQELNDFINLGCNEMREVCVHAATA